MSDCLLAVLLHNTYLDYGTYAGLTSDYYYITLQTPESQVSMGNLNMNFKIPALISFDISEEYCPVTICE